MGGIPSVDSIIMLFKKLCAVDMFGFERKDEAFPPKKKIFVSLFFFQWGLYRGDVEGSSRAVLETIDQTSRSIRRASPPPRACISPLKIWIPFFFIIISIFSF